MSNWRENIPSGERLYSLLAIGVIVAAVAGDIFFVGFSIVPQWQTRGELAAQLTAAQQQLLEAQAAQEQDPSKLKEQLEAAQATLEEAGNVFFSESQAAEVLNGLYQYADESEVEIINLQNQPGPEQEEKPIYDVKMFQLQVEGAVSNLITFVSRIEEASFESFAIANVNIAEGEEPHTLTMDITLYTSPFSSGATEPVTPGVTPTPVNLTQLEESLAEAWESRDWERAITLINQILAIDPKYDDMVEKLYNAHVNYGYQLLEEEDAGGAIVQFNLALEIKPDGEEALTGLQQATTTPTPTLTAEEQLEQSLDDAWGAENWEEAISLIEQILALDPDRADMTEKLYSAHVNYGYSLADEKKLEEAKEQFTTALTIKPDGAEAIAGLEMLSVGTPTPAPTPTPPYIIHVVRPGENLFRIALRYGTTVEAIRAANGLTSNTIHVGQQLRIPR